MPELKLTEDDICYIVGALLLASSVWGSPNAENAKELAKKFRDLHNRSLCDDKS